VRRVLAVAIPVAAIVAVGAAVAVLGGSDDAAGPRLEPRRVGDLTLPARVEGRAIAAATADGFAPLFWAGVNLGSTVPGTQPGEVAATRQDYDRWLAGMSDLGARVVRIYTILGPQFYDALAAYNAAHADRPIFFMQGVWIPEEEFVATGNAYDRAVTEGFEDEISDAVDVVHGDAKLPEKKGHAGGTFGSDVSRWLLAFSIGVEWDPAAVESTDKKNAGKSPYKGRYIRASKDATPMESWIASMLDHTARLDAKRGWSRPLTFTNWLTVDPLKHPDEPLPPEDLVSVDATHVSATDAWPGGFFASYHAYPYYPDFMSLTKSYQGYKRPRDGKVDPYAGYLHQLREYHGDQAVAITEFGVPSSLGVAHRGPIGRDQGDHSESEAMSIDADMLRDIQEEGFAAGVLFEWTDEWFKFTWNTLDLELPRGRRQLWRNDLTNEEHFGVVASEPGSKAAVVLDGKDDEWQENGSQLLAESRGNVREVRAVKDEEYLYVHLRLDEPSSWRRDPITLGLDVRDGENRGLPGHPDVFPEADVALTIGPDDAELFQAAWWEPTRIRYGLGFKYFHVDPEDMKQDSGVWVHPLQILNRPQTVPSTGEKRPAELNELGSLALSGDDRDEATSDQHRLIAASGSVVEVRLPWALLGFSDPSSHKLYVEHPDGPVSTTDAQPIRIAVVSGDDPLLRTTPFTWEPWQKVAWHERRKAGFDQLGQAIHELSAPPQDGG
jgi:hypothetical protein